MLMKKTSRKQSKQRRGTATGNMVQYKPVKALATLLLLPFAAVAARVEFAQTPAAEWADAEAETNIVFCTGAAKDNKWEFSIELDAAIDNCLEVVFGTDADGDGTLGIEEGEMSVGWDCGEWFLRDRRANAMCCSQCEPGRQRLEWTLHLDSQRRVKKLESNVFGGAAPLPFFNPDWNMARVVAGGSAGERVESRLSAQGFSVRVR